VDGGLNVDDGSDVDGEEGERSFLLGQDWIRFKAFERACLKKLPRSRMMFSPKAGL
jgi:hypothetical protein